MFEVNDHVELVSTSHEDFYLFSGDTGVVVEVNNHKFGQDIRVAWDKGQEECWIDADDFVGY